MDAFLTTVDILIVVSGPVARDQNVSKLVRTERQTAVLGYWSLVLRVLHVRPFFKAFLS